MTKVIFNLRGPPFTPMQVWVLSLQAESKIYKKEKNKDTNKCEWDTKNLVLQFCSCLCDSELTEVSNEKWQLSYTHASPHMHIQLYQVLKSSVIWPTPAVKTYLIFTFIVFSPTMVNWVFGPYACLFISLDRFEVVW